VDLDELREMAGKKPVIDIDNGTGNASGIVQPPPQIIATGDGPCRRSRDRANIA
jgi:hypothetical protein